MKIWSTAAAIVVFSFGLATAATAQTRSLALAWDANPEPFVAGYIVYVGSASGAYDEQYDVGNQQSFVYDKVISGRPYFFAVAAYSAGPVIGPASEEIFFLGGAVTPSRPTFSTSADVATAESASGRPVLCGEIGSRRCYEAEAIAAIDGLATALTPTSDGRLFFIEDRRSVRLVQDGRLLPSPALNADPDTELVSLVLDPDFVRNRFVYLLEVSTRRGGREASVLRYREVANGLGEGAAVVTSLPLPTRGDAALTNDAAGRLYLAMPAATETYDASAYAGKLLRFERNGAVPAGSPAQSPVFAEGGFALPTALAWSGAGNMLWMTGSDQGEAQEITALPLERPRTEYVPTLHTAAPQTVAGITAIESVSARANRLLMVHEQGSLSVRETTPNGLEEISSIPVSQLGGFPLSAVFGAGRVDDDLFVAIRVSANSSQIFHLTR